MAITVGSKVLSATGGAISTSTGYVIHTFTSSGTFTPNQSGTVEVLVVGAGGSNYSQSVPDSRTGGGGGGSVIYRKFLPVGAGVSYSVEIGQIAAPISFASTFTHPQGPFTAPGGARGGTDPAPSRNGVSNPLGSGGGAFNAGSPYLGGAGANVIGLGFSGGNSGPTPSYGACGGGGGAGGLGFAPPGGNNGGDGGIGVSYSISGSSLYYGSGGGGSRYSNVSPPSPAAGTLGSANAGISLPLVSYGRGETGRDAPPISPPSSPALPGIVIIRYSS
jgi:hypothetical protein